MATKRKRDMSKGPNLLGVDAPQGIQGVQQFRSSLQELDTKAQTKIKSLTSQAEQLYDVSSSIVQVVTEEISGCRLDRFQALLMVVDSILKKVGRDYKTHFSARLPSVLRAAYQRSDPPNQTFMQKMVTLSWKKHESLPYDVCEKLEAIFLPPEAAKAAPAAPPDATQAPPPKVPKQQPPAPPVQQATAPAAPVAAPAAAPAPAPAVAKPAPVSAESDEVVARRLTILTKIIERKPPQPDELQEIMKVPEIRKAIAMQQKGQRQEATTLLSDFKKELERKHKESLASKDPRLRSGAQPEKADPRRAAAAGRPTDPRQQQMDPRKPQDPRQAASAAAAAPPQDPRQAAASDPRQPVDPRSRQAPAAAPPAATTAAKVEASATAAVGAEAKTTAAAPAEGKAAAAEPMDVDAGETVDVSDDEDKPDPSHQLVPTRQILQGLPSIGFSEPWLRQFMSQMPSRSGAVDASRRDQAPAVGRKVLAASGDQMVYVDEISPNEMLLLMQFVFMLEERLRRTGRAVDLAQRVPHTFSFLQADQAVGVMLKWLFEEQPFQCTTTGLRFATREKLRKHDESVKKRKIAQQQRLKGVEARGWMESIPEWVGNRDLVVGPALFRLGGTIDEPGQKGGAASGALGLAAPGSLSDDEDGDGDAHRWVAPCDERRSVCPISGEPLELSWSAALNDWAFSDVVALEMGSTKPLEFPPGGPMGPHGLSETAVLMKKSCFKSTSISKRLEALDEMRGGGSQTSALIAPPGSQGKLDDPDLASFMKDAPRLAASFF
eukprot:TRINITY_DN31372_c0_g1_i1.p1 TRINITY_DN31372_c0_g1~~TRINITY_DN31372_c0_g1_i1.p1  ORF type:complete len:777 (-),score=218.74 TRINITY_DN31372_c0_g1_i1:108-2438(-)